MATPLRYALILLLWAIMAAVYLPLAPAAWSLITPALSTTHWLALFADPQLPQALLATLVSVGLAAGGRADYRAAGDPRLVARHWLGTSVYASSVAAGNSARCLRHQRAVDFC